MTFSDAFGSWMLIKALKLPPMMGVVSCGSWRRWFLTAS
jgi:hypothetical protein